MSFEVVWPRRPRRPRKELGEYFQRLHFWNQFVPLIKMHYRVRYSLDFDLKIRSGQGWYIYHTCTNYSYYHCWSPSVLVVFGFKRSARFKSILFSYHLNAKKWIQLSYWTEVGRAPLIHFQKTFFRKGFLYIKISQIDQILCMDHYVG